MSSIQNGLEVERTKLQTTVLKLQDGTDAGGVGVAGSGEEVADPQWLQTLHLRRKVITRRSNEVIDLRFVCISRNC